MEQMFFESKTNYAFDETIEKLSEIIAEGGWKISHIHDLQETMRKNGKEISSIKVIELCKPDYAYRILSDDASRIYSSMMPCRLSVYAKTDGQTYISRMNNGLMASQIGGVVQEVMSAAFSDVEGFIEKIVK